MFKKFRSLAPAILLALLSCDAPDQTGLGPDNLPNAGFYNNAETLPLFDMIDQANRTIDIEIYQMSDADVRAKLRKALERGVRIRVVKDPNPLGDPCKVFDPPTPEDDGVCLDQKKLKDEIINKDGTYVPFQKEKLCANPKKACFEHGKMVISDGRAVLISTGNFNSSNLCNLAQNPSKCNRDFSVIVRDQETISFLTFLFEQDLKAERFDLQAAMAMPSFKTKGLSLASKLTVSPWSLAPLVGLIDSAKDTIRIENQYLKEPTLNEALFRAARNGVRVEVTLASVCSFGKPSEREAESIRKLFEPFEAAGISVKMLPSTFRINGKPGYLHSKAIVIDDKVAWVGSVNGSSSATSNNREFGIIFSNAAWVAPLRRILTDDHAAPEMESVEESIQCKKDRQGPTED